MNTINSLTERIERSKPLATVNIGQDAMLNNILENQETIMQALRESLQNQQEILKRLNNGNGKCFVIGCDNEPQIGKIFCEEHFKPESR